MMQIYHMLQSIIPELRLVSNQRCDYIKAEKLEIIKKRSNQKGIFAPTYWSLGMRKWSNEHQGVLYRLQKHSEEWIKSIPDLSSLDLVIMDDPVYFLPLFKKLVKLGVPVIGVIHNIESLASDQVKPEWHLNLLEEELKILKHCRLVITISREEDIFLSNIGISTLYIPYYPVEPIFRRLTDIRESRRNTEKDGVLMIGSTKNLPTCEGMHGVASFWEHKRLDRLHGKLIIGGYKSETYFDASLYPQSVDFRGTLKNDALDDILKNIKVSLCFQKSGSGALTRIAEMLIAGVPVLANTQAARSYYNIQGVMEFRELEDLYEILANPDNFESEIRLPDQPDTASLGIEIKRCVRLTS